MNNSTDEFPERLTVVGATDLERRLLAAGTHEQPSPELRQRMAMAIGVSAGLGAATGVAAAAASSKGAATATALLPWISAGVVALTVGGLVAMRSWSPSQSPARQPAAAPAVAPAPARVPETAAGRPALEAPRPAVAPPSTAHRGAALSGDLGEQIALLDRARSELAGGGALRTLELARRYQDRYPAGSFRPEAAALRIEALVKLGRTAEARALVDRFVTEYGPSPLSDRVTRLVREP
jgi:hypothetical protein